MARFSSDCKKMGNYQDRSNEVKFFLVVAEWLEDGLTSSEEESSEEGRISQKRGSWKIEDRRRQSSQKNHRFWNLECEKCEMLWLLVK